MTTDTLSLAQHYQQALTRATTARTELAQEVEDGLLSGRHARRADDPAVARLCLIASLYKDMLDRKREDENNYVFTRSHFGPFSTLDLIHLLEGDEEHSPGMATLDLEDYGTVMPTREGWTVTLTNEYEEPQVYLVEAETLHTLLLHPGNTFQLVPFFAPGVLPSESFDQVHLDGMSVVVAPQTFPLVGEVGEVCEIEEPIRLSMHYERYAVLVWSVAYQRYGLESFKPHHETTLSCFGESRIPRNSLEAQYWMDMFTYRGWSEEDQQKCFLPGYPFSHLTKEAMGDMMLYQKLVQSSRK